MIDRENYTPEECHEAADSIEKVGGVYKLIAEIIRIQNPIKDNNDS